MKNLLIILLLLSLTLNVINARIILEYQEQIKNFKRRITYLTNDIRRKVNEDE